MRLAGARCRQYEKRTIVPRHGVTPILVEGESTSNAIRAPRASRQDSRQHVDQDLRCDSVTAEFLQVHSHRCVQRASSLFPEVP